jgi:hypothetical protein
MDILIIMIMGRGRENGRFEEIEQVVLMRMRRCRRLKGEGAGVGVRRCLRRVKDLRG